MDKATAKATITAKKLGKSSQASAKVLANLFPGYSAGSKRKFDPYSESVVAEQHRQKKASFKGKGKGRSKAVLVMIIEGKTHSIPKGDDAREQLKEEGRAKMINFYRYMSSQEVNDEITKTFLNLQSSRFLFLKPNKKNGLAVAENQTVDGNDVFEIAKGGKLYLRRCKHHDDTTCTNPQDISAELPPGPISTDKHHDKATKVTELIQRSSEAVKRLRVRSEATLAYALLWHPHV